MIPIPWTDEQVASLNAFQRARVMYPFTCGYRDDHYAVNDGTLVATRTGWVCPYKPCDYMQEWAHDWMFDPHWLECLGGIAHLQASLRGVAESDL